MFWKRAKRRIKLNLLIVVIVSFTFLGSSFAVNEYPNILITEISANDPEFVELYNPTDQEASLEKFYICYYSANRNSWENPYRKKIFPNGAVIQPHSFFLVTFGCDTSRSCPATDWDVYARKMIRAKAGTVAILDSDPRRGDIVDAVGWGKTHLSLGTPASPPNGGGALSRKTGADISRPFQYKGNNDLDFWVTPPSPSSSSIGALIIQSGGLKIEKGARFHTLTVYNASPAPRKFQIQVKSNIGLQTVPNLSTVKLNPDEQVEIDLFPERYEFYALDLETSGLNVNSDSIIEIGWAYFLCGEITETYSSLVRYKGKLDPYITSLTGITSEMLQTAPLPESVIPIVLDKLDGYPVVSYSNTQFDKRFLESGAKSLGLELPYFEWVDAYHFAERALPELSSHSLESVTEKLGIEGQHHRASPDARMTGIAFLDSIKRLGRKLKLVIKVSPTGYQYSAAVIAIPINPSLLGCKW